MSKILFRGNGGLGKIIAMTGVVRQFRNENPKCRVHVMSPYPDVWANLDFVEKFYPTPTQNAILTDFYDNHEDFDVIDVEPYIDLAYRQGKEHLIETWCRRAGLASPVLKRGTLMLSHQERNWAIQAFQHMNLGKTRLVAFQPFGGTPYSSAELALDPTRTKQVRDLTVEKAQEIVDLLNQRNCTVLQISLQTEPQLRNTVKLPVPQNQVMSPRYIFALLEMCSGLIAVDSFAQHAWAALERQNSVVLWGATNPANLGYSSSINMEVKDSCVNLHCNRPVTHLYDMTGDGKSWNCPYNGKCMGFNAEEVVRNIISKIGEQQ